MSDPTMDIIVAQGAKIKHLEAQLATDSRHWRWEWHLRAKELRAALEDLVTKIGQVHADPAYMAIWQLAQAHGVEYGGPSYGPELDAAIAALRASDGIRFAEGEGGTISSRKEEI